ncbi:hypothetical protein JTB14_006538 [Gonioctena quinquepunctata]|nr:hypothetical protein JTB14_006538 [Gonioctena quinquepunctata]
MIQKIQQDIWKRWHREYLHTLQQRGKWLKPQSTSPEVGSLVVIKDDNSPPCRWMLARVVELHPGRDSTILDHNFKILDRNCVQNGGRYSYYGGAAVATIANVYICQYGRLLPLGMIPGYSTIERGGSVGICSHPCFRRKVKVKIPQNSEIVMSYAFISMAYGMRYMVMARDLKKRGNQYQCLIMGIMQEVRLEGLHNDPSILLEYGVHINLPKIQLEPPMSPINQFKINIAQLCLQ